jgi:trimeric autotransporter adhesin
MLTPSWLRKIWKQSEHRRQRSERRRRRDRITPHLSGAVLEERQVLNGVPILVAELAGAVELNSGTAADDGMADVYHARVVEHDGQDRLQITVNDQIAYSGSLGSAASITIRGSSDADILVVYGSQEHPDAWTGLTFDAGGGADRLILIDWSADSVQHTLTGDGAGQLSVANQDLESVLTYRGVESITDSIDASIREFRFTGEGNRIELSDDGGESNGISRLSGDGWPEVMFASPGDRLQIDTTSSSVTRIDVRGLDASFDADLDLTASANSLVRFERDLVLGSGDLRVQAGEIEVSGTVRTSQAAIELDAGTRIHLESGSSLQNDGGRVSVFSGDIRHDGSVAASGGAVTMQARGGTLIVSGTVDVSDSTAGNSGGTVQLLGDRVGLLDAARIDASGSAGGGRILIGGDYQGANPDVSNALRTYVGAEVRIAADALDAGDGGTVIVWADEVTRFYGQIAARGGESGGNGGFVEVSGKEYLAYRGSSTRGQRTAGSARCCSTPRMSPSTTLAWRASTTWMNSPTEVGQTTFRSTLPQLTLR